MMVVGVAVAFTLVGWLGFVIWMGGVTTFSTLTTLSAVCPWLSKMRAVTE